MWVKVCGITRAEDARLAAQAGASAIGFVFWPRSLRAIDPETARRIAEQVPGNVLVVGVFVNQSPAEVAGVVTTVGLDAVQLHGDEDPLHYAHVGAPIIKAVPLGPGAPGAAWAGLPPGVVVLIDGALPTARGGTGSLADWPRAAEIAACRQTILAGGLTPENVASAITAVRPFGVDVSSGVELRPGVKDPDRLKRFVRAATAGITGGPCA